MMTATEAKEFLMDCSKSWDQPRQRIEDFLAWQRHASKSELEELENWHKHFLATCPYPISADPEMVQRNERNILDAIAREHNPNLQTLRPEKNSYLFLKIAAIVLIVIGLSWALWQLSSDSTRQNNLVLDGSEQLLLRPGSDQAMLTLADGSKIILDSNHTAMDINGVRIKQVDKGIISFTGNAARGSGENTLTTGVGGTYQIILPDGSHIWLNSNSSLHFPNTFATGKREVSFTGEGYFEIKPDAAAPFTVKVRSMEVKVLGTGFNIMAYENEDAIKTTLLHGSIHVKNGANEKLIQPGEQVALKNGDTKFSVSRPKLAQQIAWRQGKFWFNRTSVYEIMRQIERWYHVKVKYEGDLSGISLTGRLSKMQNAAELLTVLEATKEVTFKVEQNIITVSPYKKDH